jgi:prepilin-type N-terminal cleavage/methylation domain-containing protein
MRTTSCHIAGNRGFTLLEIIITLVVAAILGTAFIQFMNTGLIRSVEPVILVQKTFALNQLIEEMTADYKKLLESDPDPLATLKTYIDNGNNTASTPYYGPYSPSTEYIQFSGGNEITDVSGEDRVLKAVIASTSNTQSLTVLFTE